MENSLVKQTRIRVVSLFTNVINHDSAIRKIAGLVKIGAGGYVCFSNVHMVIESFDNAEYGAKVNNADLVLPDGMPLVWMQKLQGAKGATRVRGSDLMQMLCEYAASKNLSVGLYGGKQEVIDAIKKRTRKELPNLKIVYAFAPPFRALTTQEEAEITAQIKRAKPDILFVGLGCPKQEIWMAARKDKLKSVMLGVGAAFDFYAGKIKESPQWMGKLGLEWLFRFTQEPRRLWRRYLLLNPRFVLLALMQLSGVRKFDR